MKQGREYSDYLEDILDAIQKTVDFVSEMSFEQFSKDDKTVFDKPFPPKDMKIAQIP